MKVVLKKEQNSFRCLQHIVRIRVNYARKNTIFAVNLTHFYSGTTREKKLVHSLDTTLYCILVNEQLLINGLR